MSSRPWHRLDETFVARVLPRLSRTHVDPGTGRAAPADGAALVRRGLAARFRLRRGRVLAIPTFAAALAARDRRLVRLFAEAYPPETGLADLLLRPASKKGGEVLARIAAEEPHPTSAAFLLHAGQRKTALRFLQPAPDAGAGTLADIAHIRAGFLDDLRGARPLLSAAAERIRSTFDALAVAEAWISVRGDRAAAVQALEKARPFARNRGGFARLAWGWGAVLGDVERAREILREAEPITPLRTYEPTFARDWRVLLGDDAAARAALEAVETLARRCEDWCFAAEEWWTAFGDRRRAKEAARKGAAAAQDTRDRLQAAETLFQVGDRPGASGLVQQAEASSTGPEDLSQAAGARVRILRDRKGAAAAFERAIEAEDNPFSVESTVEAGVKALGARVLAPIFERRARRASTFDDHLAFAKVRVSHLPDPRALERHVEAAAGLAAEPQQKRDFARFLRESGGDIARADRMIDDALSNVDGVEAWIQLTDYKPGIPSNFFRKHWPKALRLAGPGAWTPLIYHAVTFQDPDLVRLVLEALRSAEGDAQDWLCAADEWRELGEPARAAEAVERAARAGALPLDLAEAWTKNGRPEKAVALLPDIEAAAAEDVLALGRCAQAWHGAGDAERARDCLERATARAGRPHEHQACATLWRNLFADLKRADACEAKIGTPAGAVEPRVPVFFAGIQSEAEATGLAEMSFLPAVVGF